MTLKKFFNGFILLILSVLLSSYRDVPFGKDEKNHFIEPVASKLSIGMLHHGGVIFHLDRSGKHGLVVSTENVGGAKAKYSWGCSGKVIAGADEVKIGKGMSNTQTIKSFCDDESFAAQACIDYTHAGYGDWYLPSLDELELLSNELGGDSEFSKLVNFNRGYYFSSSQLKNKKHKGNYAWSVNIQDNYALFSQKSSKHQVRAIRSF